MLSLTIALHAGAKPASPLGQPRLPDRMIGMYCLAADNTVANYTDKDDWQPGLYPHQQHGANVIFLTFIDPTHMTVPPAFKRLADTRGTSASGALPQETKLIFSVGGYSYSMHPNPWPFLQSADAATAMAQQVARWADLYGADGIDLDIESGAGSAAGAGENMMVFVKALRKLAPNFIITQPVFGYPQVPEENYVTNHAWTKEGTSLGLVDRVGIMVYESTGSLQCAPLSALRLAHSQAP